MGELFRRFWLPALLSEELPGPDCEPVRLRLLGEDLIAFKDSDGKIGILDAYCPHRSAPMFFARNEELRLALRLSRLEIRRRRQLPGHAELPSKARPSKSACQTVAYATADRAGMIWIYMGPRETHAAAARRSRGWTSRRRTSTSRSICSSATTRRRWKTSSTAATRHSCTARSTAPNMSWALWSKAWGEGGRDTVSRERGRIGPPRIAEYTTRGLGEIVDTRFGSALVRSITPADAET